MALLIGVSHPSPTHSQTADRSKRDPELDAIIAKVAEHIRSCVKPKLSTTGYKTSFILKVRLAIDAKGMFSNPPVFLELPASPEKMQAAKGATEALLKCQPFPAPGARFLELQNLVLPIWFTLKSDAQFEALARLLHKIPERTSQHDGEDEKQRIAGILKACIQSKWQISDVERPLPKVRVKIVFRADGSVAEAAAIEPQDGESFRSSARSAIAAIHACEPFALPLDKYDMWKEVILTFDDSDMVERPPKLAITRPPGITNSSGNAAFAQIVSEIVKRSAPKSVLQGSIRMRIVIPANAGVADIAILNSSNIPELDLAVRDALRKITFPQPPDKATMLDRLFFLSYVYK